MSEQTERQVITCDSRVTCQRPPAAWWYLDELISNIMEVLLTTSYRLHPLFLRSFCRTAVLGSAGQGMVDQFYHSVVWDSVVTGRDLPCEAVPIYAPASSALLHKVPPTSPRTLSTSACSRLRITFRSPTGFRAAVNPSSMSIARDARRESRTKVSSPSVGARVDTPSPRVST